MVDGQLETAIRLMRRYALWIGLGGLVLYGAGMAWIYSGIGTPVEAFPLLWLGHVGVVAAGVLVVLSLVARRLQRLQR
ncbi:hypothetical protein [Kumtagia ephedrae]|uniref:Uncharacterized protein n=1 Tax=Kumtagia ephedrae TaxID=2116701 RepID=A0A2P7S8C1_9HYPH|nr:hypothetical protein [Mesorhizobium ephedrae]PSJ58681.1 hypothetical protein C7I84_14425 [Mesorhizobium ephedrae]